MVFTDIFLAVGLLIVGYLLYADISAARLRSATVRVIGLRDAGVSMSEYASGPVSIVTGVLQTPGGPVSSESRGALRTSEVRDWVGTERRVRYDPKDPSRFEIPDGPFLHLLGYGVGGVMLLVGVLPVDPADPSIRSGHRLTASCR
ncbi:hypothetical protein [Luteipulveratus halotolerans]|uniref:DUF3592 domain-containing protein n=1 Tax=Luteipulveratus halotolerans TaxID=1631356 RepID=A0A0L6CLD5_9MICO|nr:hypothetical protein [Luteipulveratus halotolerans]KNX38343.1 hypothetical protein VV01_16225 [Luteipulveratus halotolerans]